MNRPIFGALVVLVLLVGAWALFKKSPYTNNEETISAAFESFQETEFKDVGLIEIVKREEQVTLKKVDGQWVVASEYGYPANSEKIEKLVEAAESISGGVEAGTGAASHSHFEVDKEKGGVVRLLDSGGKELGKVFVGKNAPGGSIDKTWIFMRFGDDDNTYKVESKLRSESSLSATKLEGKSFLDKDVYKLADDLEVQSVRVIRPDKEDLLVERRFRDVPVESEAEAPTTESEEKTEPETKKEEYFVVTVGAETHEIGSSERWQATGVLDRRKRLSMDEAAEPKDLAEYGLDQPQLKAVVQYRMKDAHDGPLATSTIIFGNAKKDDEGKDEGYYFAVEGEEGKGRVYILTTYKFDGWNKELENFLPKPEEPEEPEEKAEGESTGAVDEAAPVVEEPGTPKEGSEPDTSSAAEPASESKPAESTPPSDSGNQPKSEEKSGS